MRCVLSFWRTSLPPRSTTPKSATAGSSPSPTARSSESHSSSLRGGSEAPRSRQSRIPASANFSKNSLTANDENMLLIRGDTRVADIYMTELDRVFRHFRARDIINATADQHKNVLLLDTTDGWIEPNFTDGTFKNNRQLLFFPVTNDTKSWSIVAATDADPFEDEDARAAKVRADKSAKAKARK